VSYILRDYDESFSKHQLGWIRICKHLHICVTITTRSARPLLLTVIVNITLLKGTYVAKTDHNFTPSVGFLPKITAMLCYHQKLIPENNKNVSTKWFITYLTCQSTAFHQIMHPPTPPYAVTFSWWQDWVPQWPYVGWSFYTPVRASQARQVEG